MAEDDGKGGFTCRASIGDILLIGEQLRLQMHADNPYLIKDRRVRLKLQSSCFVGSEVVDWLLSTGHVPDRELAALLLNILVENKIIKHVTNEFANFGDDNQYYRFRKDDGSFPFSEDLNIYLKGQRLYNRLYNETCGDVMQNQEEEGEIHHNVFQGSLLVDWMIDNKESCSRDEAIRVLRKLLQSDVIRHVTDLHHFKDEPLLYQFKVDFGRPRILLDLILPPPESLNGPVKKSGSSKTPSKASSSSSLSDSTPTSSPSTAQDIPRNHTYNLLRTPHRTESGYHSDHNDLSSSPCPDASPELFSPRLDGVDDFCTTHMCFSSGMLIRSATIEELENPNAAFSLKHIRVASDPVGFGFVIRGDGPVYVKTVDPTGPAAAAGLKVGHFVHSVNDQKVLNMNHRDLAHLVLENMDNLNLLVMVHHHDRRK